MCPAHARCCCRYPYCKNPASTYLFYGLNEGEPTTKTQLPSSILEAEIPVPTNITDVVKRLTEQLDTTLLEFNDVHNITNGTRPLAVDPCAGPCLDLQNASTVQSCQPTACNVTGWARLGYPCDYPTYKPNILATCYCHQQLMNRVADSGLVLGTMELLTSTDADICTMYANNYFWNRAMPYIGMAALVYYNFVMLWAIRKFAKFQRLRNLHDQRVSIMLKVCLSLHFALLVLQISQACRVCVFLAPELRVPNTQHVRYHLPRVLRPAVLDWQIPVVHPHPAGAFASCCHLQPLRELS